MLIKKFQSRLECEYIRPAGMLLLSADLASELPGPGLAALALPHWPAHPRGHPGQPGHHARQGHPRQGRPRSDLNSGDTLEAVWKALFNSRVVGFYYLSRDLCLKSRLFASRLEICSSTNQFIFINWQKTKSLSQFFQWWDRTLLFVSYLSNSSKQ